jgi:regulation of enolase protein 1 (concanavalin A-like superfamily)
MADLRKGIWLNKPRQAELGSDSLRMVTDERTDFWRETHYGFTRDNGHFLGIETGDGFTAQVRIRAKFERLYDQAGIMVRIDERQWIKAGLEFSDGHALLGSVLTLQRSDWATGRFSGDPMDFWMRVSLADSVLRVQASADGRIWPLVRLCSFPKDVGSYRVGPMCCTPERAGLAVHFSDWTLTNHLRKDLHDLE